MGVYSFDTGDTSDCLDITIFNDILLENTESLEGRLVLDGGSVPGVTLTPVLASIEISDNDGKYMSFVVCVWGEGRIKGFNR